MVYEILQIAADGLVHGPLARSLCKIVNCLMSTTPIVYELLCKQYNEQYLQALAVISVLFAVFIMLCAMFNGNKKLVVYLLAVMLLLIVASPFVYKLAVRIYCYNTFGY